jgi:hypothetical protein
VNINLSRQSYLTTGLATPWSYKMTLNKTYKLSCTGSGGTASKQIIAKMTFNGPQPSIRCTQDSDCGKQTAQCVLQQTSLPDTPLQPGYEYISGSSRYQLQVKTPRCISANSIYAQCSSDTSSYLGGLSCSTGSLVCTPIWLCDSSWSACTNGQQTKTCTDLNKCITTCTSFNCTIPKNKPATTQSCAPCVPNWQCGDWSTACYSGQQTRNCADVNRCGINIGAPSQTQSCALSATIQISAKNVNGTGATTWPYISPMYSLTVPYDTAATISWSSTNTTSCIASGDWSGSKAVSGTESTGNIVLLTTDEIKNGIVKKLYSITCTNSITGETVKSSIIKIVSVQPNIYLRANNTPTAITVPYNTPVTLTWGAGPTRLTSGQLISPSSCNLGVKGYAGSSVPLSGSKSMGNITSNTTYTLGCLYPNDWPDAPSCNAGERCCARQLPTSMDVGNGAGVTVEGDNIFNCLESVNPSNGQYTVGKSIDIDIVVSGGASFLDNIQNQLASIASAISALLPK